MGSHAIAKEEFLLPLPFLSTCIFFFIFFFMSMTLLFEMPFCVLRLVLVRCSLFFSFCEFQVHCSTSFSAPWLTAELIMIFEKEDFFAFSGDAACWAYTSCTSSTETSKETYTTGHSQGKVIQSEIVTVSEI